ncbi:MAG: ATP-binding cassette domain-containing protein [bacterium]|nr:ATP-binding cassette domain-containing protein [bacterium]
MPCWLNRLGADVVRMAASRSATCGELCVTKTWFLYQTSEQWVLHDVSLTVRCSERVALVGRSGSGKTALANLLPRYHTPEQGRVLAWDGVDVQQLDRAALRRQISLVRSRCLSLRNGKRALQPDLLARAMSPTTSWPPP